MKVLITNTTLLNTGDSAIVEATIAILRQTFGPDISVACYDAQAFASARYRSGAAVRPTIFDQVAAWAGSGFRLKAALLWLLAAARLARAGLNPELIPLPRGLRRTIAEYRSADIVVSAGGTYLVPNYRLLPKIYDFLVTLALGRPLVLFTQSLGPFPPGRDRRLLRYALRRARLVMVRDQKSREHLAALGVPDSQIAMCADAAFAFAPPEAKAAPWRIGAAPRIGVSLRDWPFFAGEPETGMTRYLDAITDFVRRIVESEDATVTFVSTCQGAPEYWTDDSRTALDVLERLPAGIARSVTVDRAFRSPAELIERLRSFDAVVATRMHAAILALCAGVPVIPVAYEFKTRELATRLGLEELVQDIDGISSDDLMRAWRRLRDGSESLGPALWRAVRAARASALGSGVLVRSALMQAA